MQALASLRVLVIDDNAQLRHIVGSVLSAAGVRDVVYAANGEAGLQQLQERGADVVFADLDMPALDGLALTRAIRGMAAPACFTPIIIMTAHTDARRVGAMRNAGIDDLVVKPLTATAILKRLDALLARRRVFVRDGDYFGPRRPSAAVGDAGDASKVMRL